MQRRYQNLLCYVLAFFMTFTGMCMETIQADSFFACSTLGSYSKACIYEEDAVIASNEDSTQRVPGLTESMFLNHIEEHNSVRPNPKGILNLLFLYLSLQKAVTLSMVQNNMSFHETCCKTIILNYIHNQDGKK